MNKTIFKADPGKQDILIEREFDAPRELVFRAYTDSDLYRQWLGPRGYETTLMEQEPKTGGSYRFIQKDIEGKEYAFHGVYHEVKPSERIIGTFEFEEMPGHVSLEVSEFEELPDDRTKVTSRSVFLTKEDRDGMMGDGDMESGVIEGYERLDELLEKIK